MFIIVLEQITRQLLIGKSGMPVKTALIAIAIPVLATAYVMLFYGRAASQGTETVEQMVTEARNQAVERFRDLRKPSQWQKLLIKQLGA